MPSIPGQSNMEGDYWRWLSEYSENTPHSLKTILHQSLPQSGDSCAWGLVFDRHIITAFLQVRTTLPFVEQTGGGYNPIVSSSVNSTR